jgi:tetratricopeptide (TPR) repeat protein
MSRQNLASILRSCGRLDEAIALFRVVAGDSQRALGPLDRVTLSACNDLGGALADSGRFDEARQVFERGVEDHTRAYGFCHIRSTGARAGLVRAMLGQRDLAGLRDLEQRWIRDVLAAPADPDPYVLHRRAVTLSDIAVHLTELAPRVPIDGTLAIRAAEKATALSGTWSGAWTYLGLVHYRLGHLGEAEHAVRASLQRRPDPQEHPLDPLLLALVHARRGEHGQALAEFESYEKLQVPSWLEAEARALLGLAELPDDVFARP